MPVYACVYDGGIVYDTTIYDEATCVYNKGGSPKPWK
jgi:hypothetical protein